MVVEEKKHYDDISREEGWMRWGMRNDGDAQNYSTDSYVDILLAHTCPHLL